MKSIYLQTKIRWSFISAIAVLIIMAGCQEAQQNPEQQLESLLKEKAALDEKIAAMEEKLPANAEGAELKLKAVEVATVKSESFKSFLEVQGAVEAEDNIRVSPKQPGIVTRVNVVEGQKVTKGMLLATLDDEILRTGMEELRGNINFANTIYEKQKALWDKKIGTEVQYLQAKNTVESLEDKLATMQKQQDLYNIYSPINGTVESVMTKVGEGVMVGMPAFVVVNTSNLSAKVNVSENYIGKIKKGQSVEIYFPDLNKTVKSKIELVGNIVNFTNRTFPIEIPIPSSPDVKPNMMLEVRIENYQNNDAILIPINSIISGEEGDYVYIIHPQNGVQYAKKTMVKTGMQSQGKTEILAGVKPGDSIIVTGQQDVKDGQAVKF